jgi:hypothetical protein
MLSLELTDFELHNPQSSWITFYCLITSDNELLEDATPQ